MIIKFCFQGEIHRSSEPPQDFSALASFLTKMFTTTRLPTDFTLSCSTPDGLDISLNSQEDYEVLKSRNYKKPVKIFIVARHEASVVSVTEDTTSPEEVNIEFETSQNKVFSGTGTLDLEERIKDLEIQECVSIAQEGLYTSYYKMPEEMIDAQSESQQALLEVKNDNHNDQINSILFSKGETIEDKSQYYEPPQYYNFTTDTLLEQECLKKAQEANKAFNEAEISNIVRETIEQQMPSMYASFKQALINEGLIRPQPQYYPNNSPYYHIPQHYQPQPQYYQARHIPQNFTHQPQQYIAPSYPQKPQYYQPPSQPQSRPPPRQETPSSSQPDLFGKVFNVLSHIPGKAVQMVDSFAQIIEGDPYIECEEGRYPKSVVERAIHMRQVFPKAPKKDMLEFVQRFPKETSLDQLIEYWTLQSQQK